MASVGSVLDPHGNMRAKDVSKVARGEQAPRPPQQSPPVSRPPPPSSTAAPQPKKDDGQDQLSSYDNMRHCYNCFFEYKRCVQEKGSEAQECKNVAENYKSACPQWIDQWAIKDH